MTTFQNRMKVQMHDINNLTGHEQRLKLRLSLALIFLYYSVQTISLLRGIPQQTTLMISHHRRRPGPISNTQRVLY